MSDTSIDKTQPENNVFKGVAGKIDFTAFKTDINNYELNLNRNINEQKDTDKIKIERSIEINNKVNELLSQEGQKILYDGIENKAPTDATVAREAFLDYLSKIDIPVAGDDRAPVKMKDLLGKEGVKLYKEAIKEERNSKAFRNAVFLESVNHFPGETWDKKMVLWIGGPSASGKSFGAESAVKKFGENPNIMVPKKGDNVNNGNNVVSVDGGVERKLSQPRQLVLQAALAKGYVAIDDLHSNTKLGIKGHVKKAALNEDNLSLVIPATFTKGPKVMEMRGYEKDKSVVQVFAEVRGAEGEDKRFQNTVRMMGESRAELPKDKPPLAKNAIKINNLDIGVESKRYEAEHFKEGKDFSRIARKTFLHLSSEEKYFKIENAMVYVKTDNKGEPLKVDGKFVECDKHDTKGKRITGKAFNDNLKAAAQEVASAENSVGKKNASNLSKNKKAVKSAVTKADIAKPNVVPLKQEAASMTQSTIESSKSESVSDKVLIEKFAALAKAGQVPTSLPPVPVTAKDASSKMNTHPQETQFLNSLRAQTIDKKLPVNPPEPLQVVEPEKKMGTRSKKR